MLRKLVNLAARLAQYRDYRYFCRDRAHFAAPSGKIPLIISVDVEASPNYLSGDHANQLIWGRFGKEEIGIARMMEVAEKYGHKLTFFVDYCEQFLYPKHFENITRAIQSRGHDLQLHAHIELLPEGFWAEHGKGKGKVSLSTMPYETALVLLKFLIHSAVTMGNGVKPVAFRGGNFRYSKGIIDAMAELGLTLSFNYNIESRHQLNNEVNLPLFQWSNGVIEAPLAVVKDKERFYPFDFNEFNSFSNQKAAYNFLSAYHHAQGECAVAVLLMHSWSFCHDNFKRTRKSHRNQKKADNFEQFLKHLPEEIEVITASGLHRSILEGKYRPNTVRNLRLLDGN